MQVTYLLISAAELSAEADEKTHNVDVTHVRRPVDGAPVFLVKRVDRGTLLQQQLRHLHTHIHTVHNLSINQSINPFVQ